MQQKKTVMDRVTTQCRKPFSGIIFTTMARQIEKLVRVQEIETSSISVGCMAVIATVLVLAFWPAARKITAVMFGLFLVMFFLVVPYRNHLKKRLAKEIRDSGIRLRSEYFFVFPGACKLCGGRVIDTWKWWPSGRPPIRWDGPRGYWDTDAPKQTVLVCKKCNAVSAIGGYWKPPSGVRGSDGVPLGIPLDAVCTDRETQKAEPSVGLTEAQANAIPETLLQY